jgi:hypothetical protein
LYKIQGSWSDVQTGNMRGMHFGPLVRITSLIAFIEQREVIDLPVPGTSLRLPVAGYPLPSGR